MNRGACLLYAGLLVLLGLWCHPTLAEDATATQVEELIRQTGDSSESRQFSVKLADNEARIATYLQSSTQPVTDSKIDTVLLGRRIMERFPSIVRVVVDFYPTIRRKTYRRIAVTKAEILAFATGQVNKEDLLNALRAEECVDDEFVNLERKKREEEQARRKASADLAKKSSEDAKAKGTVAEAEWKDYTTGLISFNYPVAWKIVEENRRDTVVEFDGSYATKAGATIQLKLYRTKEKKPVLDEARKHVHGHMRYRNHQVTQKTKIVKFGIKNAFTGVTESFSHSKDGDRMFEEHVYFGWPGAVYKFRFSCSRNDYNHVNSVFQHLLTTIKLERPSRSNRASTRK